jgi:NAD(P)-dependent dehydrogenase (short-subunit alcohol dehydrogenase family)
MNNKVLITGASRGLGLALVGKYLDAGWTAYAGVRDPRAKPVLALKAQFPERLLVLSLDVSDTALVEAAARELQSSTDVLDVIINNAAVQLKSSRAALERIDFDGAMETYNVNALGSLRVTQAFLPFLLKGDMKVLVNISSEAGSIGQCQRVSEFDYCMSKAALNMQSVIAQNYLKQQGVKVLAIHPGWVRTDMGGPGAQVEADIAAEGILRLIETYQGHLEAPTFIDYTGQVLDW